MASNVEKVLISLKKPVKRQLDAARQAGLITDMSALVNDLLGVWLASHMPQMGEGLAESVAARLTATVEAETPTVEQVGLSAGREWAASEATVGQLRRLGAMLAADYEFKPTTRWGGGWMHDLPGNFFCAINGLPFDERQVSQHRYLGFWQRVMKDPRAEISVEFIEGFARGAAEIWSEVGPLVDGAAEVPPATPEVPAKAKKTRKPRGK